MSILETFYILFKSDASDVKKGAEEAEKSTAKLEDRLKSTGVASQVVGQQFEKSIRSAIKLFAGFASFATIFGNMNRAVANVSEIGNVARDLNVNVEALDAWGHAVQRTGGSAASFQGSLRGLAEHLGTTSAIALKTLPMLADSFHRMNNFQANRYGKSLGLDQATIYLLQQGRREVEDTIKQQQKLGVVTAQQVEVTRKYDNALYDAGRAYQSFYRELAIPLLPGITSTLNYFIEHKDIIIGAMGAIGIAVAAMGARFLIANPAIAAVAGALAAVGLAYEDIKGFIEGGKDTLLGDITGVGKGGFKQLRKENDEWAARQPEWVQKLLGTKAPDYATQGFSNPLEGFKLDRAFFEKLSGHNALASKTVRIENITINTQATDASAIAGDISRHLNDHLAQANSQFDNGVGA